MEYFKTILEVCLFVIMFLAYKALYKSAEKTSSRALKLLSYGFLFQCFAYLIAFIAVIVGLIFLEDGMDNYGEIAIGIPYLITMFISVWYFICGYMLLKIE